MTRLFIVRHGETDSNLRNTFIGRKDVPLNKTGEKQAEMLAQHLQGINFAAAYSSPQNRAINTIRPFLALSGEIEPKICPGLAERDWGIWDDLTVGEVKSKYPDVYDAWFRDMINFVIPNGESVNDAYERTGNCAEKIISAHTEGNILIATHLCAGRAMIAAVLGMRPEDSEHFFIDNAGVAVIEISDNKRLLRQLNS